MLTTPRGTKSPVTGLAAFLYRKGEVVAAQDALDSCSGTPRSWGRWSQTSSTDEKQSRPGQRKSYSADSSLEGDSVGKVSGMDAAGRSRDAPAIPELASWDPIAVATLLEVYGRVCYEERGAETINVIVQRFPYLKNYLAGPWRLLTTWEGLWPGKVHRPMPARNGTGVGLGAICNGPPDRLLWAVEAVRNHCTESA